MRAPLFNTRITEMLGIRHPILCGGMGPGVSDARYVAAVVNAGGMFAAEIARQVLHGSAALEAPTLTPREEGWRGGCSRGGQRIRLTPHRRQPE